MAEDETTDDLATTFIARQIQHDASDADYWGAIAKRVDSFLASAFPPRLLPAGYAPEDLRQDVFVKLVSDLPTMEVIDKKRFWAFVKTLAERSTIDAARRVRAAKRGGRGGTATNDEAAMDAAPDLRASTASGHARAAEIAERELECVQKLPRDEAREVYLLRRRDLQSFDDIAKAIGRDKSVTVRTIYMRAQRDVTRCLMARLDGYVAEIRE